MGISTWYLPFPASPVEQQQGASTHEPRILDRRESSPWAGGVGTPHSPVGARCSVPVVQLYDCPRMNGDGCHWPGRTGLMIIGIRVIAGALFGDGTRLFVSSILPGHPGSSTPFHLSQKRNYTKYPFPKGPPHLASSLSPSPKTPRHRHNNPPPAPSRPSNPADRSPANQATRLTTTHCRPRSRPLTCKLTSERQVPEPERAQALPAKKDEPI
jgi:hypothetical protein